MRAPRTTIGPLMGSAHTLGAPQLHAQGTSLELLVKRKRRSCSKSRTSSNSVALGLVHCAIYLYTALACYPANPMPCVAMSGAFEHR